MAAKKNEFEVIVGNIGMVYHGSSEVYAFARYDEYVSRSKKGYGRAAGESVILFKNGNIRKEHFSDD